MTLSVPTHTLPRCELAPTAPKEALKHKLAALALTATPPASDSASATHADNLRVRLCTDCLDLAIETLREEGYTDIHVTAPELAARYPDRLKSWRA